MRRSKSTRYMHGAVIVETTIVLPFLFLLMLASIEGGRLIYSYNTLSKMTYDAARFLSDRALDADFSTIDLNSGKVADVKNFLIYGNKQGSGTALLDNLNSSQITIMSSGDYIVVEIDYPFTTVFGDALSAFSYNNSADLNMNLHAESILRAIN